ncbi:hypothetical protein JCM21714_4248 [Gracilibacillus boraciitolerans JCM 21714]|uniref:Uncharacterized protein n=1 Tax=Gracilibacillus boraciitolerans JCM 21714 TaxID=1298598 RepID=W4VQB0_9BACI|nr:hypothetical protein [Gracilibacillus boraciitolerans]GAE95043.1 hypothetical protein JCM21714_4248 [Gracilibacillus boraciitolerans JCM 21714]
MIEKWITEGKLKATKRDNSNTIIEMDVLDFIDELRWSGTAYEKEMDDQIKIGRMEKEISLLHKKVDKLKDEKIDFEFQLGGISPFN